MADIILDRQRDYPADVSHYPVAFTCCKQWRRNILFFLTFVFCFVQFFPRKQISVLNIVPPPWPVLKFCDLVRKWLHNSDDSTDIIFTLTLSVLYFNLISSCVIHQLLWHLFFAALSVSPVSRPDDLVLLLKFGFVGVHQYSSLNTLFSHL